MASDTLHHELVELAFSVCDGTSSDRQIERIEELIAGDRGLRLLYLQCLELHFEMGRRRSTPAGAERPRPGATNNESLAPSIVIDVSSDPAGLPPAGLLSPGSFVFSYGMSAAILGICLLIGWAWKVSNDQPHVAASTPRQVPSAGQLENPLVGRITGLADCRWAEWSVVGGQWSVVRESQSPSREIFVSLGAKYRLASGFMEITYDTGAKVILQGPATYEVESARGGFLAMGKLTARVESQGAKGERTANPALSKNEREPTASLALRLSARERGEELANQKSEVRNQKSPNPQSLIPNPLFSVRTPTAVVTDLGTEFGVEVNKSGATKSHVFQGRVQVQLVEKGRPAAEPIQLGENDEADIEAEPTRSVKLIRGVGRTAAPAFVRQMPRWVPIKVFSTGVGLKEGDPDSHWQLAARSDEANFKPRPAIVTRVDPRRWQANDPSRSQWISMGDNLPKLPNGVTYTFRTTFELPEGKAVLRGWFLVDNHVDAIRINGRPVPVPEHPFVSPLIHSFVVREGLARGANVLEIEVQNGAPTESSPVNPMTLRVELEGAVLPQ